MKSDKFSIVNKIMDLQKLRLKITAYEYSHRDKNFRPYLFMNNETLTQIIEIIGYSSNGLHGIDPNVLCGHYFDAKVFCDNTLNFGEIELR